ncbi:hypothetical protein CMUS01_12316 [Colletotrichum musicola]|uniref:Uncharacterized protein n=1 Tax=Colletotrichum musicola TaxID=2175873 RepID=A0A8H6JMY1_9PEZI|nr:hypothetical protein CMUS01_12316 [Colletotrichum musicola]
MLESICACFAPGEPKNQPTTSEPAPGDKSSANQECNHYKPAPDSPEQEDNNKDHGPVLPDPGPVGSGPGGPIPGPEKPEDDDSEIDTGGVDLEPIEKETEEPDKAFATPWAEKRPCLLGMTELHWPNQRWRPSTHTPLKIKMLTSIGETRNGVHTNTHAGGRRASEVREVSSYWQTACQIHSKLPSGPEKQSQRTNGNMSYSSQSYGQADDDYYSDYGGAADPGWYAQGGGAQYITDGGQTADHLIDPLLFSSAAEPSTIASFAYSDPSPIYTTETASQGQ